MARLNTPIDSDNDLPDVSFLLAPRMEKVRKDPTSGRTKTTCQGSPEAITLLTLSNARRQRPLKLAHVNSLLLPLAGEFRREKGADRYDLSEREAGAPKDSKLPSKPVGRTPPDSSRNHRASPRKTGPASHANASLLHQHIVSEKDASFVDDLSGFVIDDSYSELEQPALRSPQKKNDGLFRRPRSPAKPPPSGLTVIDLTSPQKECPQKIRPVTPPHAAPNEGFDEDSAGRLRFSPPRSRTPHRRKDNERVITPPSSPSKEGLLSPSKRFNRIPPSPHRPSIDAFWSQEIINDWNDQHSPLKLISPRKLFSVREDDEAYLSPSTSPRRSPTKTPSKRDKAAIERKKAFEVRKVELASQFLRELDNKVAEGRVGALAESAGGIKIIWSKKLSSTAGRANWKRETLVSRDVEGTSTKVYRHHASIELAEKIIDDEERLINVLAHEYCHLANFMISGIKNNPHGKEFKQWAAKTTGLFSHRNIVVTTKHTYAISYKYIWQCSSPSCGIEYKRHSKSIDPVRHSCGACKGKLVQIQPAPRNGKLGETDGNGGAALSAYQAYVKSNCARIRRENPGMGLGEVMKRLGKEFREMKAGNVAERRTVNAPVNEIVEMDGDAELVFERHDSTDDMVKKLDFLSLR